MRKFAIALCLLAGCAKIPGSIAPSLALDASEEWNQRFSVLIDEYEPPADRVLEWPAKKAHIVILIHRTDRRDAGKCAEAIRSRFEARYGPVAESIVTGMDGDSAGFSFSTVEEGMKYGGKTICRRMEDAGVLLVAFGAWPFEHDAELRAEMDLIVKGARISD